MKTIINASADAVWETSEGFLETISSVLIEKFKKFQLNLVLGCV